MEKKISYKVGLFAIAGALLVIGFYYFGVAATLRFCVAAGVFLVYLCLSIVSMLALVVAVCGAVTSVTSEIHYGGMHQHSLGSLWWESTLSSLIFALGGLFVGNLSAIFAGYTIQEMRIAELLGYEVLLPAFWKPYLFAHVISLVFGIAMFLDRRYCWFKRKHRQPKVH